MAVVVPNEGEKRILDRLVAGGNLELRLFKNNITPDATSVYGDFTQCDFSGYAVGTPAYGAATTNGGGQAQADAAAINFDHSGGATANTVYGWYLVDSVANKVLKANTFTSPITMSASGNRITITEHFLMAGTIT